MGLNEPRNDVKIHHFDECEGDTFMKISRHSLIFGLSYALDIAGRNNLSHSKSVAYIAVLIGRELGLDNDAIIELFYTGLLHDIAMSNTYDMVEHCVDGEEMLSKLPLPKNIAKNVYYHHEFYDGSGNFGLSGDEIPQNALIVCFASAFDDRFGKFFDNNYEFVAYRTIEEWLHTQSPLFSERIVEALENLIRREAFLLDYFNSETKFVLYKNIVSDDGVYYDYDDVVKYALCFADIIDCKSPFTHTHSLGIANLARQAAAALGYDENIQKDMYIAGLLHDIGKLDVSPDILHKNGPLTLEERFEINKHTYFSRKILEQIDGFEDIVNYAANHHERLDGTGYPYRMEEDELSDPERIMAICDVYQALTEERPYREKLSSDKVWRIIDGMVENRHLDALLVSKLKRVFD